jgi:hypothetical protein
MLKRLLVVIALLLALLSAPATPSAPPHALADDCFPPVEVPLVLPVPPVGFPVT